MSNKNLRLQYQELFDRISQSCKQHSMLHQYIGPLTTDNVSLPEKFHIAKKVIEQLKHHTSNENIDISPVSVNDSHRGELFGHKELTVDGVTLARMHVNLLGNTVSIMNIVTKKGHERQGLAKRLVDDLFDEFPEKKITVTGLTDKGHAFFTKYYTVNQKTGQIKQKSTALTESQRIKTSSVKNLRNSLHKFLKNSVDSSQIVMHSMFEQPNNQTLELKLSVFGNSPKQLNLLRQQVKEFVLENDFVQDIDESHNHDGVFHMNVFQIEILPVNRTYRSGVGYERMKHHLGLIIRGPQHVQTPNLGNTI